jgi:hypothetical protein
MTGWRKGATGLARRVVVATGVALLVVGAGSRVNVAARETLAEEWEPVLRRPVRDAVVDVRSLASAARTLGAAAEVRIDVAAGTGEAAAPATREATVRYRDVPLGRALGDVLARFDQSPELGGLMYVVDGEAIRVGLEALPRMRESHVVRVYDVADLLAHVPRDANVMEYRHDGPVRVALRPVMFDAIVRLVQTLTAPTTWNGLPPRAKGIKTFGERLVVTAPPHVQREVTALLFVLRNPATAEGMRLGPGRDANVATAGVAR